MNGSRVYKRIVLNQVEIIRDTIYFFNYLVEWKFKDTDKSLGNIPYLLIIKEDT